MLIPYPWPTIQMNPSYLKSQKLTQPWLHHPQPRLNQFPGGAGKGHDTALMNAWLQDLLEGMSEESVETCPGVGLYVRLRYYSCSFGI